MRNLFKRYVKKQAKIDQVPLLKAAFFLEQAKIQIVNENEFYIMMPMGWDDKNYVKYSTETYMFNLNDKTTSEEKFWFYAACLTKEMHLIDLDEAKSVIESYEDNKVAVKVMLCL